MKTQRFDTMETVTRTEFEAYKAMMDGQVKTMQADLATVHGQVQAVQKESLDKHQGVQNQLAVANAELTEVKEKMVKADEEWKKMLEELGRFQE